MDRIHGVFVDLDIIREGGYVRKCRYFRDFPTPYTGDPDARCVFVPKNRESQARLFLENPETESIDEWSRGNWQRMMVGLLTHEIQHVLFGESQRPDNPAGRCSLATIVFRRDGKSYSVRHYLSEMSAILSEFRFQYQDRSPSTLDGMDRWITRIVTNDGESIRGILTNLRCVCDCDEVDEYTRQTVAFTIASWSDMEKTYLLQALQRQDGIDWPMAPAADLLETLRGVLDARAPGRTHAWTVNPGFTMGFASVSDHEAFLARAGVDFGIPLDRLRQWEIQVGLHETYLGSLHYQSFLTGVRTGLSVTAPGKGFSFRAGAFGELGAAAISEAGGTRPDGFVQSGLTLGFTVPSEAWGRLSIGAEVLGGTNFGASGASASPWYGVGLRFGVELFVGGD